MVQIFHRRDAEVAEGRRGEYGKGECFLESSGSGFGLVVFFEAGVEVCAGGD